MGCKRESTRYDNKTRCGCSSRELYWRHMITRDKRDEVDASSIGGWHQRRPTRSMTQASLEFEHHFSQLLEVERSLVGMDKVLFFMKTIDQREMMAIGIEQKDNDCANCLTEDWAEIERVC